MSARSLNSVQLIGNLTRDPELRYTTGGTPVVTFGVATNKSWKDKEGEVKEVAEFHNVVAWNKMAEICQQLLAKGMKVYIEGSLSTRSWEADDGSTRYKTEIRVNDMILLDSKGKQGDGSSIQTGDEKAEDVSVVDTPVVEDEASDEDPLEDSDLPF
ncbi:MAG: single-stranded DNA-binding protein [Candidatus Dojkabacteria bacterium]|jgi:single-strand DNA-binding protein